MAVPFAQTSRSLKADRGIASLVFLATVSLLLIVWLVWAFTANFSVYAVSDTTQIRLDDTITVLFSADAGQELRNGQKALVYLDAPPLTEPFILPGQVIGLESAPNGVRAKIAPDLRQIEAGPMYAEILNAFSQSVSGHIEVETETLSPASLVLRSAGLNADTAPLVSNP